jgi:hypothetical protein
MQDLNRLKPERSTPSKIRSPEPSRTGATSSVSSSTTPGNESLA